MANKIQIENERKKIRELIAKGYSSEVIKEKVGLSTRTYGRRLSDMKMSDLRALADQDDSTRAIIIVNTLGKLDKLQKDMQQILDNPDAKDSDKIKAAQMMRQFIIDSSKLFLNGSEMMNVSTKYLDVRHNGDTLQEGKTEQ
jgi:hypothetical protein